MKTKKKKLDFDYIVKTYELPMLCKGHIVWMDIESISHEDVSNAMGFVDHWQREDKETFLIYRQFMLLAGYVPRYLWIEDVNPLEGFQFEWWKSPQKTTFHKSQFKVPDELKSKFKVGQFKYEKP